MNKVAIMKIIYNCSTICVNMKEGQFFMDSKMEELIEKITREVISSLSKEECARTFISGNSGLNIDKKLAAMIDHTILKPEAKLVK